MPPPKPICLTLFAFKIVYNYFDIESDSLKLTEFIANLQPHNKILYTLINLTAKKSALTPPQAL